MIDEISRGNLYIVATPIGNLKDITFRAVEVLKGVDLIAAEDTRRARILMAAYEIKTPLTSLHEHNEYRKSAHLIDLMRGGKDVAYITNAGTPAISDPGCLLVKQAMEKEIRVIPIPGPSAVITALSVSGLPASSFIFDGFLPTGVARKRIYLTSLQKERRTVVVYESPNRLLATLKELAEILPDREVFVFREMTKIYEEGLRGSAAVLHQTLKEKPIKGEVTLIIPPAMKGETQKEEITEADILNLFQEKKLVSGLSRKDIIALIARELGVPRKMVYEAVTKNKENSFT